MRTTAHTMLSALTIVACFTGHTVSAQRATSASMPAVNNARPAGNVALRQSLGLTLIDSNDGSQVNSLPSSTMVDYDKLLRSPLADPRPRATGVIAGRVVYESGAPASGVVVFGSMQPEASAALEMKYMMLHGGRIKDKTGKVVGFTYNGPIPEYIERVQTIAALTDSDGAFRLVGAANAPYDLWAAPKGTGMHSVVQKPWPWVSQADAEVTAQEDHTVSAPDLTLTHGVLLSGQVLDQVTDRPLKGIIVSCWGPHHPVTNLRAANAITDAKGLFVLRVLPGVNRLSVNGVLIDVYGTAEVHDDAAKLDGALWSIANKYSVSIGSNPPHTEDIHAQGVNVDVQASHPSNVVIRLKRTTLQHDYSVFGVGTAVRSNPHTAFLVSVQTQDHSKFVQAPADHSHDVSGTFSLDRSTVVSGAPVLITYRVTNNTSSPIQFEESVSRGSVQRWEYKFTATDAKGRLVSPPEGGMIVSGFSQSITVTPGKTSLLHVDLSDWFQIKKPGLYIVHCTRTLGLTFVSSGAKALQRHQDIVTSANLILKVLPAAKHPTQP